MAERVVAERVAVSQLAQERGSILGADLPADHEEGGPSLGALEHRHERARVRRGPVIESDRDLAPPRAMHVGVATAAATTRDAIQSRGNRGVPKGVQTRRRASRTASGAVRRGDQAGEVRQRDGCEQCHRPAGSSRAQRRRRRRDLREQPCLDR